jgi:GTPase KRas protein
VKPHFPVFIIVGNMSDQSHQREVSHKEGEQLANYLGCGFMETSAKTAQNVESMIAFIVRSLRTRAVPMASSKARKVGKKSRAAACIIS